MLSTQEYSPMVTKQRQQAPAAEAIVGRLNNPMLDAETRRKSCLVKAERMLSLKCND